VRGHRVQPEDHRPAAAASHDSLRRSHQPRDQRRRAVEHRHRARVDRGSRPNARPGLESAGELQQEQTRDQEPAAVRATLHGAGADMTRSLWDEGGTSRDYDDPITRETMGDGWDLNAPPSYTNPSTGITYPYTQGPFRYRSWSNGGDVRAYLQSGTYVKLRDISLSYEAPASWLQQFGARSMRLTFQARNPFMFTHYWSFDPEYNNFGATNLNRFIDLAPYPSNRQFFLSVDVGW